MSLFFSRENQGSFPFTLLKGLNKKPGKFFGPLVITFLLLFNFGDVRSQCYNSGWGTGIYYGTGSYTGGINSCSGGTQQIPSTQYQQWDGVAGYNYSFSLSGGFASGSTVWTYFEVVGGSWTAMQNGIGTVADVTAQNTSPIGYGWNLIVFYNNSSCPPPWNGSSATMTYRMTTNQAPTVTVPANITVCSTGPTVVNYTTPTSSCSEPTYLLQGLASGSTFPIGTTYEAWSTYVPNGAGGYFTYPYGASSYTIAQYACQSVYGAGNCTTNGCGNFSYWMSTSNPGCNCGTAQQQYEFIYSNTGYTQVGQDYGGGTDDVTGNYCFARVKADGGCDSKSWRLAQKLLGQGGSTNYFTVTVADPSLVMSGTTSLCVNSTSTLSGIPSLPTGGIITSVGGYRIHEFLSTGTFTVPSGFNGYVDALVVGGGGGGGTNMGGGGGGGGVLISPLQLGAGSYTATVGAGGAGAPAGNGGGHPSVAAQGGQNSSIGSLTAIGGGRGGTSYNTMGLGINLGGTGGSGGGAEGYNNDGEAPGTQAGGAGTAGQGYRGGNQGVAYYAAGGGGAGGPGADGDNQPNGGPGIPCAYLGTNYYWGGGGGGASYSTCGGNGGIGGGGGGAVCTTTGGVGLNNGAAGGGGCTNCWANSPGGNAGANTGGGGGGGSHYNATNAGGNGGSGIVVIRYPDPTLGTWSSSNNGVATVNSAGVVTGVAVGTAVITYTVTVGGCSSAVSNTVTVNGSAAPQAVANITAGPVPTFCGTALLPDANLTASSNCCGNHEPYKGRLFNPGCGSVQCWASANPNNFGTEWWQEDLGSIQPVNGIATQGRGDCCPQWVTSYTVQLSMDGTNWYVVPGTFTANSDQPTVVTNWFGQYHARYVRIYPQSMSGYMSMRADVLSIPEGATSATQTVWMSAEIPTGANQVRWYTTATGGLPFSTSQYTSVSISQNTTYYAESYNTSTGCTSLTRTAVIARVNNVYGKGPAAVGNTSGTSLLNLWLNASQIPQTVGTAVATFTDGSGKGNNATQATGANQPTLQTQAAMNGQRVIRGNGTSQFISTSSYFNASGSFYGSNLTPWTVLSASKYNGSNQRVISSSVQNWLLGHHGALEDRAYYEGWLTGNCGSGGVSPNVIDLTTM